MGRETRVHKVATRGLGLLLAVAAVLASAPRADAKSTYWPMEFDVYPEVDASRSAESADFAVYWGTLAGADPRTAPPAIRFDPAEVLSQLEGIYTTYIRTVGFLDDTTGNLAQYKFIVVMNDTWSSAPWTGWAFGGSYDSTIGAMWIHPQAVVAPSWGLAHEFAHSLQNQVWIDHPGHGFIDFEPAGFFWETHAQFMAEQHYPTILEGTDFIRFFNTAQFHWSSTRHHYGNTLFLRYVEDTFGLDLIGRLWRESLAGVEHPLDTLKRLAGLSQEELDDHFGHYALKNVVFDYSNGAEMRRTVANDLDHHLISRRFTRLVALAGQPGAYAVPYYMAPQDYGYNTVELRPDAPTATVDLTFYGQPNVPAGGNSFRFGLVAVDGAGAPRYSPLYTANAGQELRVTFALQASDERLYLVVLAAPRIHHSYVWEPGWPKIYRYPWQVAIAGATPFVDNHEGIAGALHPNGGGFVATTASVAPTVYVGPDAQVLGNATATGNVRLEDEATLTWEAVASGDAIVRHAGYVGWSRLSGSALIEECAMPFADSGGTFIGGGDEEGHGTCDDGCYRQFPHPNNGRTACDLRPCAEPANVDVNPAFPEHVFGAADGPGRVATLFATRAPGGAVRFTWSASCSPAATDYAIYEGQLGSWSSHLALDCSDGGGDRTEVVTPSSGNRYYLVVPLDARPSEGSYGLDRDGLELPPGVVSCAVQVGSSCR